MLTINQKIKIQPHPDKPIWYAARVYRIGIETKCTYTDTDGKDRFFSFYTSGHKKDSQVNTGENGL